MGEGGNLEPARAVCHVLDTMAFQMDGAPTSEIWRRLLDSTRGLGHPANNNNDPRKRRAANIH